MSLDTLPAWSQRSTMLLWADGDFDDGDTNAPSSPSRMSAASQRQIAANSLPQSPLEDTLSDQSVNEGVPLPPGVIFGEQPPSENHKDAAGPAGRRIVKASLMTIPYDIRHRILELLLPTCPRGPNVVPVPGSTALRWRRNPCTMLDLSIFAVSRVLENEVLLYMTDKHWAYLESDFGSAPCRWSQVRGSACFNHAMRLQIGFYISGRTVTKGDLTHVTNFFTALSRNRAEDMMMGLPPLQRLILEFKTSTQDMSFEEFKLLRNVDTILTKIERLIDSISIVDVIILAGLILQREDRMLQRRCLVCKWRLEQI